MLAEPRWLIIIGLGLDIAGAVLIAITALSRVKSDLYFGPGGGQEQDRPLARRRWMVGIGGFLLVGGFAMQGVATAMQISQAPVEQWTIWPRRRGPIRGRACTGRFGAHDSVVEYGARGRLLMERIKTILELNAAGWTCRRAIALIPVVVLAAWAIVEVLSR